MQLLIRSLFLYLFLFCHDIFKDSTATDYIVLAVVDNFTSGKKSQDVYYFTTTTTTRDVVSVIDDRLLQLE